MGRARVAVVLLVAALVAGCVKDDGPPLAPAAEEDAPPTATPSPTSPPPRGNTSTAGTGAPATPSAPSSGGTRAPAPPPAGWTAGPGTQLRALVDAAIAAGAPVTVPVMPVEELAGLDLAFGEPVERDVVLRPSVMVTAASWAEVDGARVGFPALAVYEGHLDGDEAALARLTVTPQWARGSVRIGDDEHVIRVEMDGNFPPPQGTPSRSSLFPAALEPRPIIDGAGYAEEDCLRLVPPFVAPQTDLGPSTATPLTARVVLDSDAALAASLGADAMAMMVAMLVEADSIYEHELGIRFQLVGVHVTTDPAAYPEAGAKDASGSDPTYDALTPLAARWNARTDVERDLVHLFADQDTGFAQAHCIGAAGIAPYAYSFSPLAWERGYPTFHTRVIAHEIGHLFSAHHHYGNHVEGPLATIMLQGYTPGAKPVFGTIEKSVIRGWAEEHLG